MDFNDFSVIRIMTGKMKWLSARQNVLAQNVANADTPHYQPKDLREIDFDDPNATQPFRVALARTHADHLAGAKPGPYPQSERQRDTYETLPSGNAVVLEEQLVKVADNRHDYTLMARLYRKHMQMFRVALGRGGGAAQ